MYENTDYRFLNTDGSAFHERLLVSKKVLQTSVNIVEVILIYPVFLLIFSKVIFMKRKLAWREQYW
jgi:hypothetical protein